VKTQTGRKRGAEKPAPPPAPDLRRFRLLLGLAVVVVHLLLAAAAFNRAPHTGGDNATYISLAHSLLETGTYTEVYDPERLPHTKYPPVFPALLALWMAAGATTWTALKTVSVLFGAAAVALAYAWASERRGPLFGAGVAFLFAACSAVLDASHWILSEPPFLAFTLLALWAFERAGRGEGEGEGMAGRAAEPSSGEGMAKPATSTPRLFLAIATAGTLLAYFTRSAGLPLLLAGAAWLAWKRGWRALALYALGTGIPIALWWLRSRAVDRPSYLGEFWMVNPYDPALGTVDVLGLAGRFWLNLVGYATRHVPGGIVGSTGSWVTALGVMLVALAAVGWYREARARLGVAELLLPLYLGLILVWPEVWSGDRFALPLYPLLFFYAGDALLAGAGSLGRPAALAAAALAVFALAAPALASWTRSISVARACGAAARTTGPFGCYGAPVQEFVRIALWSRGALPPGSSVLSRKPTIFYVMSGLPSRTFPFSLDPEALFAEARATGSRYVVLDQWDAQAMTFVGEAVARRPEAFCAVGGFDPRAGGVGTLILGMVLDAPPGDGLPEPQISLERCPPEMLGDVTSPIPDYSSSKVPLLSSDPAP
jgi:hypothetical protein